MKRNVVLIIALVVLLMNCKQKKSSEIRSFEDLPFEEQIVIFEEDLKTIELMMNVWLDDLLVIMEEQEKNNEEMQELINKRKARGEDVTELQKNLDILIASNKRSQEAIEKARPAEQIQ